MGLNQHNVNTKNPKDMFAWICSGSWHVIEDGKITMSVKCGIAQHLMPCAKHTRASFTNRDELNIEYIRKSRPVSQTVIEVRVWKSITSHGEAYVYIYLLTLISDPGSQRGHCKQFRM